MGWVPAEGPSTQASTQDPAAALPQGGLILAPPGLHTSLGLRVTSQLEQGPISHVLISHLSHIS